MLGIDIGSYSIKIVQLTGTCLQMAEEIPYPGWPNQNDGDVRKVLAESVARMECEKEEVWSCLAGTPVITHIASFPPMSPDELDGAVRLEAEQFVSQDWEQIDFDYEVIDSEREDEIQVLFVAAPREMSDQKLALFRESGLYCRGITVEALALARSFTNSVSKDKQNDTTILVAIGASKTNIVLFNGERPTILRDISFGGNDITECIAKEFSMDFKEAERIKRQQDTSETRLKDCMERSLQPLIRQLSRTIEYGTRQTGASGNDMAIVLYGGGSLAPGLPKHLADNLGVPVRYSNPFAGLEAECVIPRDVRIQSRYGLAIGCALIGEMQADV